jgi:hypothetical protein
MQSEANRERLLKSVENINTKTGLIQNDISRKALHEIETGKVTPVKDSAELFFIFQLFTPKQCTLQVWE